MYAASGVGDAVSTAETGICRRILGEEFVFVPRFVYTGHCADSCGAGWSIRLTLMCGGESDARREDEPKITDHAANISQVDWRVGRWSVGGDRIYG
jgi:hypothetical protein